MVDSNRAIPLTLCHTYLPGLLCFSCYGLDPDTPDADYEVRFVRAQDPAYLPPDSEAWPFYFQAAIEAAKAFPGAVEAILYAVRDVCQSLRGRRGLPPQLHAPVGPHTYEFNYP